MTHETTGGLGVGSNALLGQWFYASYGFETVVGQCKAVLYDGSYMLAFRWGGPLRTQQKVETTRILGRAEDPRWPLTKWLFHFTPNAQVHRKR